MRKTVFIDPDKDSCGSLGWICVLFVVGLIKISAK